MNYTVTIEQPVVGDGYNIHTSKQDNGIRHTTQVASGLTGREAALRSALLGEVAAGRFMDLVVEELENVAYDIELNADLPAAMQQEIDALRAAAKYLRQSGVRA